MIDVNLMNLMDTLEKGCRGAVITATGDCVSRSHYELRIEHVLLAMAENPDDELARILDVLQVERSSLCLCLRQDLAALTAGNTGRPVLSPFLVECLQDAWLVASIEYAQKATTSGTLWAVAGDRRDRFLGMDTARHLDDCGLAALRLRLGEFLPNPSAGPQEDCGANGKSASAGVISQYCVNFCEQAKAGQIDPVFGRDPEIGQMIDILGRRRKNNPIIVADPGVGKTALVEGLALRIAEGKVPGFLRDIELLSLDIGLLQAGASVKGEFEKRLKDIVAEVERDSRSVILFFDEAHMLIGAGAAPGGADAANLLKPALARGNFRAIAATTWKEYRKYFEKDPALSRRFQIIGLESPSPDEALSMLRGLRDKFEESHGVYISDEAVEAAVKLSARYIASGQLPDKAIDVLDTTAARARISMDVEPMELAKIDARVAELMREVAAWERDLATGIMEDTTRLNDRHVEIGDLEERRANLNARWREEKLLLEQVAERSGMVSESRAAPISQEGQSLTGRNSVSLPDRSDTCGADIKALRTRLKSIQEACPLAHFEVTPMAVAATVSDWTGVPLAAMLRSDIEDALGFAENLGERVCGQRLAVGILDRELRMSRVGLSDPDRPRGVFLLTGPSGVGKTETAIAVADLLFGGQQHMTVINMSEYQERHTVSKLFGAPPGYVGYGEGGILTEAVRRRPFSIVLLDEVEKGHPDVLNAFYQAFDKGFIADGEGRSVDFRNTVIVMTCNVGSQTIADLASQLMPMADSCDEEAEIRMVDRFVEELRPELTRKFRPALLARMRVVPYMPLDRRELRKIVCGRFRRVAERIRTQKVELDVSGSVLDHFAERCAGSDEGVRNVDALINQTVLPNVSRGILRAMHGNEELRRISVQTKGNGELHYDFEFS